MRYTPIIGTLGFVLSKDKKSVLLVHRIGRKGDDQYGKYNGLGGKMHENEDALTCMRREIHEEANIECQKMTLRGVINWTGFGPKNENWLGFVFLIEEYEGIAFTSNEEGPLEWVPLDKILHLALWEGDYHFFPLVFDGDPRIFYGYMALNGAKLLSWTWNRN